MPGRRARRLRVHPIKLGEAGEAGFGRATLTVVATGTGTAVFLGEAGQIVEVLPDGSTRPWEGSDTVFEEGEPFELPIAPAGEVESTVTEVSGAGLLTGLFGRQYFTAAEAPRADGVVLVDDGAPMLFAPGQVVAVGVQDGQGDLRTITAVDDRTILFDRPVAAAAGDVIVMLQPAPVPTGGGDGAGGGTSVDGAPDGGTGVVAGVTGERAGAPVVRDDLPRAGADVGLALETALAFLLLGAVLLGAGRRREEDLLLLSPQPRDPPDPLGGTATLDTLTRMITRNDHEPPG